MPNPRNRLKLTGDTHLPDVGDEGAGGEDVLAFEPAQRDDEGASVREVVAERTASYQRLYGAYLDQARDQVRQRPVVALASAFALGLLLARI